MPNSPFRTPVTLASRNRGLTLIELLVAITVLAIVAVLGWRGLDSIVRARVALNENLEQTRGMQLAFAQLESDCAHMASPLILPNRVPLVIEPGRLRLVRVVFSDNQPSRLQVVTYRLDGGVLSRRESAETRDLLELDTLWLEAANTIDDAGAVVLQTGVDTFDMRQWLSERNGWYTGPDTLSGTAQGTPAAIQPRPTGLEVSIGLAGHRTRLIKIFLLGVV